MLNGNQRTRRLRAAAIVGACALATTALTGIAHGSAARGGNGNEIVFAADLDLSGPYQGTNLPQADGMRAAVDEINASGGLTVKGKTYQIRFEVEDNEGNPSRSVSIARQILADDALAAIPPDVRYDAIYELWKDDLITIGCCTATQELLIEDRKDNPRLISQIPLLRDYYAGMWTQVPALVPGVERIALMNVDDENGRGEAEGIAAAAEAAGLEVVASEFYPLGTEDFTPFLTALQEEDFDLLVAPINPAEGIPIVIQAAQLGVAPAVLTQGLNPEDLGDLGPLEGITLVMSHFSVTFGDYVFADINDGAQVILESTGGERPIVPEIAVDTYNTTRLIAMGIEEAGTVTNAQKIVKAMKKLVFDGPFGPVTLTKNQAVVGNGMYHVVRDGTVTVYLFESVDSDEPIREESFPI